MTTTLIASDLKAAPGEYIFDASKNMYIGRMNGSKKLSGTEDKRFVSSGARSMMNGILSSSGYTPKNPQKFADRFVKPNNYMLQGFTLIVESFELSPELWAAKAAELMEYEADGIRDILDKVSKERPVERQAKMAALGLIFGKSLKKAGLITKDKLDSFQSMLKSQGLGVEEEKAEKYHAYIRRRVDVVKHRMTSNETRVRNEEILNLRLMINQFDNIKYVDDVGEILMEWLDMKPYMNHTYRYAESEHELIHRLNQRLPFFLRKEGFGSLKEFMIDLLNQLNPDHIKEAIESEINRRHSQINSWKAAVQREHEEIDKLKQLLNY